MLYFIMIKLREEWCVMSELLRMEGISKSFGTVQAVRDVSVTLHAGEVLALMGENGAGKSTLMNILCGAITHFSGHIFLDGNRVTVGSPSGARSLGIAKIHQELQLVQELSIAENMFMGREMTHRTGLIDRKAMEAEAQKYLDMLEMGIKASRPIKTLRVGEQQMVEIAKAISLQTRILIMDEPTSAISKSESEHLFKIVRKLAKEGVGIIYITHRMEEVFQLADRLMVMRDGQYVDTVNASETSREQVISMMVGRKIAEVYPKEERRLGEEVLRVERLSLKGNLANSQRALYDISFALHRGEVLGIAGLLGSGRTELLESIFGGHAKRVTGSVFVEGRKIEITSPAQAIKAGISFATEDRKGQGLVLPRSIGENMSLPKLKQLTGRLFMNKKLERAQWQQQMDAMRIKAPSYHTLTAALSGGNQQKVVLGRWLMTRPKVLLLDEPTRGIDVGAKAEIYQLVNQLAAQGMGMIVVSSELPEVIGICDRILTLCEGRITGEFTHQEATQEKLLYAATLRKEEAV